MKKSLKAAVILLMISLPFSLCAQPWVQNDAIFNPGGIPSLPFSQPRLADLDNDGDLDMTIGNINDKPFYLENIGTAENPQFVSGADYFANINYIDAELGVFADLDDDGDLDFISGGYTGLHFFENTGDAASPQFEEIVGFFNILGGINYPVPDLADVDDDGDLDLVIGLSESGMVKLYENIGTAALANFSDAEAYEIDDVGLFAYPCFADLDNDGDTDLLVGRDGFGFRYFQNTGSASSAEWTYIEDALSGIGFETYWNSPDLIDLDNNGTLDLIFGTASGPLEYYVNIGTPESAEWEHNTSLFGGVIDVGGASNPFFVDYDNDGDLDMFTGSQMGDIKYFENTGTVNGPSWTENSAPFSSLKHSIYSDVTFGDLNGNGRLDAVVGDLSGNLFHHNNNGLGFSYIESTFAGFSFGGWSSPYLIDLDNDEDLDLVIGNESGTLHYIENQGDSENAVWVEISNYFGGIDVGSNAVPSFADLDFDGDQDMAVGNISGNVKYYENQNGSWVINNELMAGVSGGQNTSPGFADLDGDGDADLALGNYDGTFNYFQNMEIMVGLNEKNNPSFANLQVFPNPFQSHITIQTEAETNEAIQFKVFDMNGALRYHQTIRSNGTQMNTKLELEALPAGVYLLQLITNEHAKTIRMIKQ